MTEAEMTYFRRLKDALVEQPVLALPRSDFTYGRDTDPFHKQFGAFLMQRYKNKVLKPIGYYSCTLPEAECNYDTTEPECFAIVWTILLLRPDLYGTQFEIGSDHDSL